MSHERNGDHGTMQPRHLRKRAYEDKSIQPDGSTQAKRSQVNYRKIWRQEDPLRYDAYKEHMKQRNKIYRSGLKGEDKAHYNEVCRLRMKKWRETKKAEHKKAKQNHDITPRRNDHDANLKTRSQIEKKRLYWREKKRKTESKYVGPKEETCE